MKLYDIGLIDLLDRLGVLAVGHIQMRMKVSHDGAMNILKKIVQDHKNVHFARTGLIYIEERLPQFLVCPSKRAKRKSKWKDIKKP